MPEKERSAVIDLARTMLDPGKAVNVVPTRAEACIDCRILPEMTPAGTRELVTGVLNPLGIVEDVTYQALFFERLARDLLA